MFNLIKFVYKREIIWFLSPALFLTLLMVVFFRGQGHIELVAIYSLFFFFVPFAIPAMMVNMLARNHQWIMTLPFSKKENILLYVTSVFLGLFTYVLVAAISFLLILKFCFRGSVAEILTLIKMAKIPVSQVELSGISIFIPFILMISFGGPSKSAHVQSPLQIDNKYGGLILLVAYILITFLFISEMYYLVAVFTIASSTAFSTYFMVRKMALIRPQRIIFYSVAALYVFACSLGIQFHLMKSLDGSDLNQKISAYSWSGIHSDKDLKVLEEYYISAIDFSTSNMDEIQQMIIKYNLKTNNKMRLSKVLELAIEQKIKLFDISKIISAYQINIGELPFDLQKKYINLAYDRMAMSGLMKALSQMRNIQNSEKELAEILSSKSVASQKYALIKMRYISNFNPLKILLENKSKILPEHMAMANETFHIITDSQQSLENLKENRALLHSRSIASIDENKRIVECQKFSEIKIDQVDSEMIHALNQCLRFHFGSRMTQIEQWGRFESPYTTGMKSIYSDFQRMLKAKRN